VFGKSNSSSSGSSGVYGAGKTGVYGQGSDLGVYGSGYDYGVYGESDHYGVYGYATSSASYAGYFVGNVNILGALTKTSGSFKIDNPLNPAGQYLYHSFVESPDMKNIYDGVVALDAKGEAWVQMPEWFEALNGSSPMDYRYQLTCIGGYAPVYIAQEMQGNRFKIAGGTTGLRVSWQVTGIRHDPYAEANRIPVVVDKPANEQGTYLYPELYGQPESAGLDYQKNPDQNAELH
jgi:hypothetical protein